MEKWKKETVEELKDFMLEYALSAGSIVEKLSKAEQEFKNAKKELEELERRVTEFLRKLQYSSET